MDSKINCESRSIKEHNRLKYNLKKSNAHEAARKPFKGKTWKHAQQWKESYKMLDVLDSINEQSFEPHFGLESLTSTAFAVDALAKFANIDIPDQILREVEGVLLLCINLTQQTTSLGAITSVLTWAQGRTSKSLFKTVRQYIEEIFVTPQSNIAPDWLDCLRDMRQNWQLCKNNRAFKQVSKLLGCLVMLGLCDVSSLTFNVGKYKLFTPELCEKHTSAFDIADALFETVVFFTEGAYMCFQTGSLRPLLINDRTAMELDQEYAQVMAWYDLVKNGNLEKFAKMSDQEFEKRMNRLSTSLLNLSQALRGPEKKLVMDKYQRVLIMQNEFVATKIASGVRHAPWAIELFGESSQGKTTLGDQLVDAVLISQGLPAKKEYRCAYNAGDKFMSNWTSDKLVMIFDDISNDKSDFVERPPTRAIIDVINNQMFYAPKAELDAKGKCFVEPWIVVATTNKQDLDAGLYSNCPYSVQRRLVCITVRAKPEFQRFEDGRSCGIDSSKVREHYTRDGVYTPPVFDDIWLVDIERAVKPATLHTIARYAPIVWNNKVMKNVTMAECIQWAIEDFDNHRKNQEALLDSMRQRENTMTLCAHEGCKHLKGNCPYHLESHFGLETVSAVRKLWYAGQRKIMPDVNSMYDAVDKAASMVIYEQGMKFVSKWEWIKMIPAPILDHPEAPSVIRWLYKDRLNKDYKYEMQRAWLTAFAFAIFVILVFPPWTWPFFFFAIIAEFLFRQRNLVEVVEENLFVELKNSNAEIAPLLRRYRDEYAKVICATSIGIAALYGLARAYKAYYGNHSQGSLEPKTREEIEQRDSEANVWTPVVKRDLPITDLSKRMSSEQLENAVMKALVYGSIHMSESTGRVNGLMLTSNVMLMPDHYFTQFGDQLNCTFRKRNPDASGGKFACRLNKSASVLIPDTDLRICYVPNGGSFKNLLNFFPTGDMPGVPFSMFWRQKDGEILKARGVTIPGVVTTIKSFNGGTYQNLTIDTFGGLCGATLVSETKGSVILGVHLGGTAGTPRGCYGSLTQQQLFTAISSLRKVEGVLLTGEEGLFRTEVLGVQVMTGEPMHAKSPMNYLPENSQIEYLGSCIGRSTTVSAVKVTPISEHVLDVCGVPNIYGGPKLKPDWFGWQTCLANLAEPAHPFPHDLLCEAVEDYKEDLLPIFQSDLWNDARPLSDMDNLNGIPGKKFIDAIKTSTSVGMPLKGPKSQFIELIDGPEDRVIKVLFPVLMDEITYLEECYLRGERGYPIAKACKKDEILAGEKCRIFYGNALSLTFLIRKYYLPILRVLQMNPLVSECAVGINSHGPEWDQFYKHVTKFGTQRLFGGDYGKYDQKLPAQLILAALRILIDFAKECDYSQRDINIMEAMAGDIVYAYIAFNGDLIGLTEGTHISGNSLTVIINGICGSLNLRCFFYTQYPVINGERINFRDCAAMMTYGDDNIGCVRAGYEKFNIRDCSKFLAEYGQVYTMPDKKSELLEFLPEDQFEFLKRQSVYHPKLGMHVGALLDKSIYKSLHCFMRDKTSMDTEESACAQNVDGALREWFNHGEEKYERQRQLMKEVTRRAGIDHICTELEVTYDERVIDWNNKYNSRDDRL